MKAISVIDRFLNKVNKGEKCWLWTGAKNTEGYGYLKIQGKMFRAARVSYELFKGIIPLGMIVMHTCDNPPCVNPAHLVIGRSKDNTLDMIKKGRAKTDYREAQLKGAKVKKQKTGTITLPSVVLGIRNLIKDGVKPTQRACRIIPGYNSIQRYLPQSKLIAMAKGEIECVL